MAGQQTGTTNPIRVHVLGRLTFSSPGSSFDERNLPGVQGTILLAFLIMERNQTSRQALADMLWVGRPPQEWNTALSSLTSKIRSLLDQVDIGRRALIASAGTLELVLPADTWVDYEAATTHLDRARRQQGADDDSLASATTAWAILKRPFLAGVDSQWADTVRRDLDRRRYEACEILSRQWRLAGDPTLAFSMAESAINLDPLRESGYRLAIEASLTSGDRALAAQVMAQCQHILREELGVDPSPETLNLLGPGHA